MQNAIVYRSRAHDRGGRGLGAAAPLRRRERRSTSTRCSICSRGRAPATPRADLFEAWYGFLLVAGNAYLEAVSVGGRLRELHVLRPDRMKVVPGPDGWPEAYEYTAGGQIGALSPARPVPGVRADPAHARCSIRRTTTTACRRSRRRPPRSTSTTPRARWNKALLDNSARPSGALVYAARTASLTGEQFERLKNELEQSFQGARNAGRPLLLEGGLDWKAMSLHAQGHGFHRGQARGGARDRARARRAADAARHSRRQHLFELLQEANRGFWRQTVLPLVGRARRRRSSAGSGRRSGGELALDPDLDRIEALSAEREALWARIEKRELPHAEREARRRRLRAGAGR